MRFVARWVGGGFVPADLDLYVRRMGDAGHAVAASRCKAAAAGGSMGCSVPLVGAAERPRQLLGSSLRPQGSLSL